MVKGNDKTAVVQAGHHVKQVRAMVKAVRMLAAANEQGKAFGFMESGRGISNTLHTALTFLGCYG